MNIFYLNKDPKKAAQDHIDKHVVKMPLEVAQMACTTAAINYVLGTLPKVALGSDARKMMSEYSSKQRPLAQEDRVFPYLPCHINHPCTIWMRTSKENFLWAREYASALNDEYKLRYGKGDLKAWIVMSKIDYNSFNFQHRGETTPALAMPEEFKKDDPVMSYKAYYMGAKSSIATWKGRSAPAWWLYA